MTYKLIVFDMDGTILDSMHILEELAVELISSNYSVTESFARTRYRNTVGHPFRTQLDLMFPGSRISDEVAHRYTLSHYKTAPVFKLSSGVTKSWVRNLNYTHRTALISSTNQGLIMKQLDQILDLGFHWVTGHTAEQNKEDQLVACCEHFGVRPKDVLYVGDTEYDLVVAANVGTHFLMVNTESIVRQVDGLLAPV